jgi:hypothetical protein
MTHPNKFEDLNDRFESLGTGMTHSNKFRDRWRTLLNEKFVNYYNILDIIEHYNFARDFIFICDHLKKSN